MVRKKLYIAIAIAAAIAICTTITAYALGGYAKFVGIPIGSDRETKSEKLPPNVEKVNVYQAGQYNVKIMRVKVINIESVLNSNNQIVGFNIELQVKSPDKVAINVSLEVDLYGGNKVVVTKSVEVAPGINIVYIALPNPVNPDDIVSLYVNAEPT